MIGNKLEQFKIYLEINARIDENKGIKFTASTIYFALYLCKHRFLLVYYFAGVIDTCKMLYPNHIKDIPITHSSCLSDEMLPD